VFFFKGRNRESWHKEFRTAAVRPEPKVLRSVSDTITIAACAKREPPGEDAALAAGAGRRPVGSNWLSGFCMTAMPSTLPGVNSTS
jgi:hypothetical protein